MDSPPQIIDRYDRKWTNTTDLGIELFCYARKTNTGNTPEWHFRNAWRLMWPTFQWNDWTDMMVWAWCTYRICTIIAHSRASKTFTIAHCALLDYLAAPTSTATTFTTTKFDALKARLWGDLKYAVEHSAQRDVMLSAFKMTDTSNEMKFGLSSRIRLTDDRYMIQGVATDSADTTAGKIRGQHADRRRIVGDEAQDISPAIYTAIMNAMSAPDFKAMLPSNPVDQQSEFGNWCTPKSGWGSIKDSDRWWPTIKPDGICLRFDGLDSPNIRAGRTIHPFLLTQQYVNDVREAKGEGSVEWWMYVRGMFPPDGIVSKVWNSSAIESAKSDFVFDFKPTPFATLDPAFEYDDCVLHTGLMGRHRDRKPVALAKKTYTIKTKEGQNEKPKDYQVAYAVMEICKSEGISPENYIQDSTGNARGVLAILRIEWGAGCKGVEYGGAATNRPLRFNDQKPANQLVKYFVSELWFRASYLARDGILRGLSNLDPRTTEDLSARKYTIVKSDGVDVMQVESKKDMKKRLGRSPDYGDPFCQIAELMQQNGLLDTIGTSTGNPVKRENSRVRAQKAASRYVKEFSHGNTS
jgi:hypothetical protein